MTERFMGRTAIDCLPLWPEDGLDRLESIDQVEAIVFAADG